MNVPSYLACHDHFGCRCVVGACDSAPWGSQPRDIYIVCMYVCVIHMHVHACACLCSMQHADADVMPRSASVHACPCVVHASVLPGGTAVLPPLLCLPQSALVQVNCDGHVMCVHHIVGRALHVCACAWHAVSPAMSALCPLCPCAVFVCCLVCVQIDLSHIHTTITAIITSVASVSVQRPTRPTV